MATILREATNLVSSSHEERQRIVRLSENYQYGIHELIARLSESQVTFTKLTDDENSYDEDGNYQRIQPSKNYSLTAAEADAFVEAWTAYKADLAAAQATEKQRKAGVLAEALRLGAELELEIENQGTDGDERFKVKHPARYISRSYAYTIDGLMEIVKDFQNDLEEEKKTIAEACEAAKQVTALCGDSCHITSRKPAYNGYYDMKIEGRFSGWTADQLPAGHILNRFKTILTDLERETPAQAQVLS